MCILDLTKVLIYEFRYDYIKEIYSINSRWLFTDTNSLMYDIITEDIYEGLIDKKKCLILRNTQIKVKIS